MHPKGSIISRFENILPELPNNFHVLFAGIKKGSDDEVIKAYGMTPEKYGIIISQKNIFSTLNHRDITCTWDTNAPADSMPQFTFSASEFIDAGLEKYRIFFTTIQQCIMAALQNPIPLFSQLQSLFLPNNLRKIDLSGLNLSDGDPEQRAALLQLCQKLLAADSKLKKLLLHNNNFIIDGEFLKQLIEVVRTRGTIRNLNIRNNTPPIPYNPPSPQKPNDPTNVKLEKAWRQRGLIFQ